MTKNKKILSVLSTTAITGLLIAAINSPVFAKASAIAVTSNDGKIYEYQYDALESSALMQMIKGSDNPGAKLYNDFLQRKTGVKAIYDDTRESYVDFGTISKESNAVANKGGSFNLNSFIQSSSTPTIKITTTPVSIDGNGNVTTGEKTEENSLDKPTVKSVAIIDSETIRVRFSKDVDYKYATNISNYKLEDNKNLDITNHISKICSTKGNDNTDNTDEYDIKLLKFDPSNLKDDWRLTGGKYTLTIKNIIDTASTPNTMEEYITVLNGNDDVAPKGTGIYANLRTTATGKDKVVIYFSEDMDSTTLTNKDNYKYTNGEGDTVSLPADATITVGGDNKSVIIEFPTTYNIKTGGKQIDNNSSNVYSIVVSNVKDAAGNTLDAVVYSNDDKIDKAQIGTNVIDNSLKVYYDGDDLKLDVIFTRALGTVNSNDFAFGGVHPSSAAVNGSKLTLIFKDGASATAAEIAAHPIAYANGKNNSNPTKIDIIKSQGQNAKLAINATTTTDEIGARVSINDDGSPSTLSAAQSTVYDYQAAPKTASNYWSAVKAANGGEVFLTFDTPLDPNSGIKTDDFTFTGSNGTDILADSVTVSGNTVVFKFNATNKNYAAFTSYVDVRAKISVSLRTVKDVDGNNACYVPSNDDIKKRTITISQ